MDHRPDASTQEPQLERLVADVTRAVGARTGAALALLGSPGIGKSWLAAQALARLSCHTVSVTAASPLARIVGALPQPPKLPGWARHAFDVAGAGAEVDAATLVGATLALLRQQAPVVLHLDDFHEASPEVERFGNGLATGLKRARGVVLLVAARHALGEPFVETWVEPLGSTQATALLEGTAGAKLPAEASAWIYERAAGNPLFTLEYLRQLSRAGHLWSDGRRWSWREPPTGFRPARVGAVIEYLVGGAKALGPDVAATLQARALLPPGALDRGLWADVADLDAKALEGAAQRLRRQGVLAGDDFAHGLVREVALASVPGHVRRQLAARAVRALEHDPVAAAAFVEPAELEPDAALSLLLTAAAAAANKTSAARLRAAASRVATGAERARLAYEAGVDLSDVDPQAALELLKTAVEDESAGEAAFTAYAHALALSARLEEARAVVAAYARRGADDSSSLGLLLTSCHLAGAHREALDLWQANPDLHGPARPSWLRAAAGSALATGNMQLGACVHNAFRASWFGASIPRALSLGERAIPRCSIRPRRTVRAGSGPRSRTQAAIASAALARSLALYTLSRLCTAASNDHKHRLIAMPT